MRREIFSDGGSRQPRICQQESFPGKESGSPWVGQSIRASKIPRVDWTWPLHGDIGVHPGTLHAAILRSPHAHAISSRSKPLPPSAPKASSAVLDGTDVKARPRTWWSASRRRSSAGQSRRTGALCRRAVAVVVATDRYLAEDAVDLIEVPYQPRPAVITARRTQPGCARAARRL